MNIGTLISTWLCYSYVGSDMFGNRYYVEKKPRGKDKPRRIVRYHGAAEASKVPPLWHSWLHYTTDRLPVTTPRIFPWQRAHTQNLTGSDGAYFPPGHQRKGGKRKIVSADYKAWKPQ